MERSAGRQFHAAVSGVTKGSSLTIGYSNVSATVVSMD
jgi:hypothetical protein